MEREMRLLIAYDGTSSAEAALDDLRVAGLPETAETIILSVVDVWLPPVSAPGYETVHTALDKQVEAAAQRMRAQAEQLLKAATKLAQEGHARVKQNFPKWQITTEVRAGSPAWEIVKLADEWQPDLIVVGSHNRNSLGRLWYGSVSHKVVQEARCSVRVARGRIQDDNFYARIIIGLDGSPGSGAAVAAVARRCWPAGSEVRLITAIGMRLPGDKNGGKIHTVMEGLNFAHELQHPVEERLCAAGLRVTTLIKEDDPKHLLVAEADRWGADVIFVGSRGLNRLNRFLLGSVSSAVTARALCSVEVVRERDA